MTMRKFANAIEGYDQHSRQRWEQARLIAYYSCIPHLKNGRSLKPSDLIPMTWDEPKGKTSLKVDKQEVYKVLDKWSK